MKAAKTFDCVQMKNDIQAKLYARRAGMTESEKRADIERQLENSNSPTAVWWRKIKSSSAPAAQRTTASA